MTTLPDQPTRLQRLRERFLPPDSSSQSISPNPNHPSPGQRLWVSPSFEAVLAHVVVPLAFIALVLAIMPISQPFEFDSDEGINVIKAFLYDKGFSLYTQVWNDQPPFLTLALEGWFSLFGQTLFAGRLLILVFSTLLVWSFYQIIRIFIGTIPAIVGVVFLVSSYQYIRLSASLMIGLPSLALAMLSLYTIVLYKQQVRRYLLPLSGILLALSLQTKLFTVFLIPIIVVYLLDVKALIRNPKAEVKAQLKVVLLWLFTVVSIYLVIGLALQAINYEQLIHAHLNQAVEEQLKGKGSLSALKYLVKKDLNMLKLAVFGGGVILYQSLYQKRWNGVLPLLWLGLATLALLDHQPIWYHHYVLLAIPLAWLTAYGAAPLAEWVSDRDRLWQIRKRGFIPLVMAVLSLVLLVSAVAPVDNKIRDFAKDINTFRPNYHDPVLIEQLVQARQDVRWLFTDRPIYAFQSGIPTPPELAVFSKKRFVGGSLAPEVLLEILERYQPERLILSRFKKQFYEQEQLMTYIQSHYRMIYKTSQTHLFARQTQPDSPTS